MYSPQLILILILLVPNIGLEITVRIPQRHSQKIHLSVDNKFSIAEHSFHYSQETVFLQLHHLQEMIG